MIQIICLALLVDQFINFKLILNLMIELNTLLNLNFLFKIINRFFGSFHQ